MRRKITVVWRMVCVRIFTYTYTYTCAYAYAYAYAYTYTYTFTYAYAHTYTQSCTYTNTYTYAYTFAIYIIHVHIDVNGECTCICMCIYTHHINYIYTYDVFQTRNAQMAPPGCRRRRKHAGRRQMEHIIMRGGLRETGSRQGAPHHTRQRRREWCRGQQRCRERRTETCPLRGPSQPDAACRPGPRAPC